MSYAFWILLSLVAYVYAGYPAWLVILRALGVSRSWKRADWEPEVTLVISAYNEVAVIEEKIHNSLALDYPRDRLQLIVVSDASDDGTDDAVRRHADAGVELIRMPTRSGKTLGLNAAVGVARGDIIAFSDANALYVADAIRKLVRNFADSTVGAVIGESTYADVEAPSERQESQYWRYETAIKRLESSIGSVVGGDGAIYAVRRALYRPMAQDDLSDFVNPLQVVDAGYRCVYEPEARSFERAAGSFPREFRRKVRIVNRAVRALFRMRRLLNPWRHGLFAFELLSHKLLRWLVPLMLPPLFVLNCFLLSAGMIYRAAFVGQLAFYLLALVGHASRNWRSMSWMVSMPYYFCLVNAASALGLLDALRGKTYTTWTTARHVES